MDILPVWMMGFFVFAFGTCIGSFLNVCIVRMPLGKSIVFPGSHCFACGQSVKWFDNIPILSYLILKGKCRYCGTSFSYRYFVIEFLTGALFAYFFFVFSLSYILVPYLILISALIVATFIDFEYRIIPDELSLYGIPLALILSALMPGMHLDYGMLSLKWGAIVSLVLSSVCLMLMIADSLIRRAPLTSDDRRLAISVFLSILFQNLVLMYAPAGFVGQALLAVVAAMQGVVIGGGALYLLGLFGAMLIRKRVVTLIDLKTITDQEDDLFVELQTHGYLDEEGEIQKAFEGINQATDFKLSEQWEEKHDEIYEIFVECYEGGVMGGGDVKLMALIGAFLGWQLALFTIVAAPFIAAPIGIIEKIRTKSSAIAFGPYLAFAAVIGILWGKPIMAWVQSGYGLY